MFHLITCFLLNLCSFGSAGHPAAGDPVRTVVIDPGHGGNDPGCLGSDAQEKRITLSLALRLRDRIRARYPEVKVVLTRDQDVFVPLHTRSDIANDAKADLFISLHCNALPPSGKGISGSETYVLGLHRAQDNFEVAQRENAAILLEDNHKLNYGDFDPHSPEAYILMTMYQNAYLEKSIVFADFVERSFRDQAGRPSKGVKQAGFLVLRENAMPSVLVETGFLTNPGDESFLNSADGQDRMADALARAFGDYKTVMEGGSLSEAPQTKTEPPPPKKAGSVDPVTPATPSSAPAKPAGPAPSPTPPKSATPPPASKPATPPAGIWYGIQIGAFSQPLPADHPIRMEVSPLMERREKGMIKYLAGPFSDEASAEKVKKSLVQSGYKGIFTVVYQGDQRVR